MFLSAEDIKRAINKKGENMTTKKETDEKKQISISQAKQLREADLAQKIFKNVKSSKAEKDTKSEEENEEILKLKKEIEQLKEENFNVKTISSLERAGCLKPELVLKSVPRDCENLDEWIDKFKAENDILFGNPNDSHGGSYKPTVSKNLSPNEIMNNFIRGIY